MGWGLFSIVGGDTVVNTGDSLTQAGWATAAGGFVDQVNAQLATPIVYVNKGVAGRTFFAMDGAFAADVAALNPQGVIIQGGVNDILQGFSLATVRASLDSLIAKATALPSIRNVSGAKSVAVMGPIWMRGEFQFDPHDSIVDAYEQVCIDACRAGGAIYWRPRGPRNAYEGLNNTPAPGVMIDDLTSDGIHPVAAGQVLMGDTAIASVRVIRQTALAQGEYWFEADNVDGLNNSTLTSGVSRPLTWKNLGTRGSGGDAVAADAAHAALYQSPGLSPQGNNMPAMLFDGARVYHTAAGAALAQPNMVLIVGWAANVAVTDVFCDGVAVGNRQQLAYIGGSPQTFAGAASGGTYNGGPLTNNGLTILIARFSGATTQIWGPLSTSTMTTQAGAHSLTGVTLGASYDDTSLLVGGIMLYREWHGADVPEVSDALRYVIGKYGVGILG